MQAVWYNKFGPAKDVLEIGDYQTPQPERGDVKVRVYASDHSFIGLGFATTDGFLAPKKIFV